MKFNNWTNQDPFAMMIKFPTQSAKYLIMIRD